MTDFDLGAIAEMAAEQKLVFERTFSLLFSINCLRQQNTSKTLENHPPPPKTCCELPHMNLYCLSSSL